MALSKINPFLQMYQPSKTSSSPNTYPNSTNGGLSSILTAAMSGTKLNTDSFCNSADGFLSQLFAPGTITQEKSNKIMNLLKSFFG